MENCIFCRIVKGEIPAEKVWENNNFLAFLSIGPINPGHTLVIPKKHTDYIFDLDDLSLGQLMVVSKPVAGALEKAFHPKTGRIGIMVAGLEVHHVHLHLIPMNSEGDLTFARARHDVSPQELAENAQKIRTALR